MLVQTVAESNTMCCSSLWHYDCFHAFKVKNMITLHSYPELSFCW